MIAYIIVAVAIGVLGVFNKMVNVKASECLGNVNGTFINYLEATIISLIAILCTGHMNEITIDYVKTVPTYLYLGSITGLIALILLVIGTKRSTVMISTVVVLIGQLSTSIVLDHIFFHENFSLLKVLGIFFVITGMTFRQRIIKKANINEAEQKGDEKAV
ncbi:MAG: DMT family transporter [Candidatus Metalachnospira sp.]|nr:DMT family transporter [Candidatus Metalachnospira sp.]